MKRITALLAVPAFASLAILGQAPAAAAVTNPLEVLFSQGDLDEWIADDGLSTVAADLAQADILVLSHAAEHQYGDPSWPNQAYGAQGCVDFDNRDSLLDVLDAVETLNADIKVFGYVSGPADAPDQVIGGVTAPALCGSGVNNYLSPWNNTTEFTACPQSMCLNFVYWVQDWISQADDLNTYIDGIFIDFVSSQHLTPVIRDNLYSYVKGIGLDIMVNSLVPGSPCPSCVGDVNNYEFAADSAWLDDDDYILVEGYYTGFPGAGNLVTETEAIADIRDDLFIEHGERPRIAALVTQSFDTSPAITCSDDDYLDARAIFDDSFVTGDAIAYQTNDLGTYAPRDGSGNIIGAPYNPNLHC
jgi:hypothetical protein